MSHSYKFVNESLENDITHTIIPSIFPSLNSEHKSILIKYLIRLMNIIAICFRFYKYDSYADDYRYQVKQNNYQDIKWLTNHLLPYLDENGNLSELTSFDDMYLKKIKDVDINNEEPRYAYSNIQYGRCIRTSKGYVERQFNMKDIEDNFYILVDTIKSMSHKMHVNWMDILPYTLEDYRSTEIYTETRIKLLNGEFVDWNPYNEIKFNISEEKMCENIFMKTRGLSIEDVYNTISHDLYYSIKNIKWLIYDIYVKPRIYPIVIILRILINLQPMLNGTQWEEYPEQNKFSLFWNRFIETAEQGSEISYGYGDNIYVISTNSLIVLLSGIIFSFDKSISLQCRKEAEKDGYKPIVSQLKQNDEDDDSIPRLSVILESLKSAKPKYIYEYISDSLVAFKNTWFGTKLLTSDKKDVDTSNIYFEVGKGNIPLTYKNIYNFSKSLVHSVNKNNTIYEYPDDWDTLDKNQRKKLLKGTKFMPLPKDWKSLNNTQKNEILKRINRKYTFPKQWFNISKYIRTLLIGNAELSYVYQGSKLSIHEIFTEIHRLKMISIRFVIINRCISV